jgi:hypothetical protein
MVFSTLFGGELGVEKAQFLLEKYEALPELKNPTESRIETLGKFMKDTSHMKDIENISAVIKIIPTTQS